MVDTEALLSAEEVRSLNQSISQLRADSIWVAIFITSLQGESIEVGYGLEGTLTDYRCSEVIHQILRPAFRQQRYALGLQEALRTLGEMARGQLNLPPKRSRWPYFDGPGLFIPILFWGFFLLVPLVFIDRHYLAEAERKNTEALNYFKQDTGFSLYWFRWGAWNGAGIFFKLFLLTFISVLFALSISQANPLIAWVGHGLLGVVTLAVNWGGRNLARLLVDAEAFEKYKRRRKQM